MKKPLLLTFAAGLCAVLLLSPDYCYAYIGPGAGFAFLSSFIFVIGAVAVALALIATLPFRLIFRAIRRKKRHAPADIDRLIIVGLDGLDPVLAQKFMDEGKLPHLDSMRKEGHFSPLKTSNPPISPVAWSSFMTGSNPGKHNIFDFLRRDPKTYLPGLSSAEIIPGGKGKKIAGIRLPSKPIIKMLRRSVPFWKILGEHGVTGTVLKVPITYPPEKFEGFLLSGLCTPDLKGTQGTFAFYTTARDSDSSLTSGSRVTLEGAGPAYTTLISGPPSPRGNGELTIPLDITVRPDEKAAVLKIGKEIYRIGEGRLSPWISLTFKTGIRGKIKGIAQFYLKNVSPEVELYLSPIQIDPEDPALPVSHPMIYSIHLAKLFDKFATLGLPQDTWALNEGILTDDGFLQQAYGVHDKLEEIFFHSLQRLKNGLLCCVFDTTDVIQHEFWRYLEDDHPARNNEEYPLPETIEELYIRMDSMVGRVREKIKDRDLLLIVSDHGFKTFRRGVDINTWLHQNGYLSLKEGKSQSGEWYRDVDWSKTRAYAFGLSGLYLNRAGREAEGIVTPDEAAGLKAELIEKLSGLSDPENGGAAAITTLYDTAEIYSGPYKENAPDLILGFYPGYRHAWESVSGEVTGKIFIDNEKAWSADHCIDHRYVPGVFFSSRPLESEDLSLQDIAPTALRLFGINPPGYMDGKVLEFSTGHPEQEQSSVSETNRDDKKVTSNQ